jgi:DNA polymerase-3 subunit epsilon
MRHIVLDTETTGLDPNSGHRIVEIGCVELVNHVPSGNVFHHYLNPEREVPREAENIHGISTEFLKDKPLFAEVAGDFLEFIAEDPLVIHNAGFDMAFLNAELSHLGFEKMGMGRAIDTVIMARKKFPGAPASLDALCKRFNVDTSGRTYHGALLDARLLADVYLELIGGKQPDLGINVARSKNGSDVQVVRAAREAREHNVTTQEEAIHAAAVKKIKGTLWN